MDDRQTLFDALDALLDRERAALTGGALDQLTALMEEKDAIMDRLGALGGETGGETGAAGGDRLAPLRDKVRRNQELLDSALSGIRAVADRMAELRRVRDGLETYDRAGRKTRVGIRADQRLEKRA